MRFETGLAALFVARGGMIEFDENPTKMAINPILTNLNYRFSTSISKYRETHEWVRDRVVILNTLIEIYAGELLDRYIDV